LGRTETNLERSFPGFSVRLSDRRQQAAFHSWHGSSTDVGQASHLHSYSASAASVRHRPNSWAILSTSVLQLDQGALSCGRPISDPWFRQTGFPGLRATFPKPEEGVAMLGPLVRNFDVVMPPDTRRQQAAWGIGGVQVATTMTKTRTCTSTRWQPL
jgi:hypothetical protein